MGAAAAPASLRRLPRSHTPGARRARWGQWEHVPEGGPCPRQGGPGRPHALGARGARLRGGLATGHVVGMNQGWMGREVGECVGWWEWYRGRYRGELLEYASRPFQSSQVVRVHSQSVSESVCPVIAVQYVAVPNTAVPSCAAQYTTAHCSTGGICKAQSIGVHGWTAVTDIGGWVTGSSTVGDRAWGFWGCTGSCLLATCVALTTLGVLIVSPHGVCTMTL